MNAKTRSHTLLLLASSAILTGSLWDSNAEAAQLYNNYKYPWLANDANWQVTQGWHGGAGAFNYQGNHYSWGEGYALDFQAISNISSQGVDILAPADSEVASICRDDNNQASISLITLVDDQLSLESMGIIHLEANSLNLSVGDRVRQGDFLGKVHREGTSKNDFDKIDNACGFGAPNHIHVRFPVRYPNFTIDGDTYEGDDTSISGKSVVSSNSPPSENPPPEQNPGDSDRHPLFQLSKYDERTGETCDSGDNGNDCTLSHLNLNVDNDNFSWSLLDIFSSAYGVEAAPFDSYTTKIDTTTFNLRQEPASTSMIASPPWGTQGKLLSTERVVANFAGTEYDWWNVDFFGYGSGWVAGNFIYQRFHIYTVKPLEPIDDDEEDDVIHSSQKVPEPGSLFMFLVPLIVFFKKFKLH